MKTSELIAELQNALDRFGDLEVIATWESILRPVAVYRGRRSDREPWRIMVDADEELYRDEFEHPDDRTPQT